MIYTDGAMQFVLNNKIYYLYTDPNYHSKLFVWDGVLSTVSPSLENSISYFPNPVDDMLTIHSKNINSASPLELTIYAMDGKPLGNPIHKQFEGFLEVSFEHFYPGIYILEITKDKEIIRKKIIKR